MVALHTSGAHPVHKATIMPRGQALGMVFQLPKGDQMSQSKRQMLAELDVCMGGRVAEELIFGEEHVTSGASSDIQKATQLARRMVMLYGFGEGTGDRKLSIMRYDPNDTSMMGPDTKRAIDVEVERLLMESYERAKRCLVSHRRDLETVAKGLLEHETLSGKELKQLLAGKKIGKTQISLG